MLDSIGGLASWRRQNDPKTGVPKTFGFAEFLTPRSAIIAKAQLNDLQLGDSKVLVKIDEKNQKLIDEWTADHAKELPTDEEQEKTKTEITRIADETNLSLGITPHSSSPSGNDNTNGQESSDISSSTPNPSITTSETMEITQPTDSTELTPTASKPKSLTATSKTSDSSTSSSRPSKITAESKREEERKRDFERKLELMEEDREREQKRLEKNDKLYRSLERELEADRRDRLADLERRKRTDEERRASRLEDLEQDNIDSEDWRKKINSHERVKSRQREREQDDLDREEEEAELRAEMRRAEERHKEQVRLQQEEQAQRLKEEAEARMRAEESNRNSKKRPRAQDSAGAAPSRGNGGTSPSRRNHDDDYGMPPSEKSKRLSEDQSSPHSTLVLGSMPSSSSTHSQGQPSPSSVQSQQTASAFAAKIPSDTASLFVSTIRWDLAEKHNLLENKVKPWVTKRILEYLEVEEPTMIQFICSHIKERKPPKELIAQLKPVFEDETEVFVITLWRMLVLESLKMEAEE
jgi:hypothetical protein